ncbi:MAG: sodium-dependent transporter [candidate division Zixibacteria bacterium]|nr:sodium-dependent transporter [candidate division Zixibacteria bacterium]
MEKRDRWDSRTAFILASIGSAIGLGNIWRFPYICYENGGGAFLVAWLVALFTAGIPLMILEFGLGHKMEGSASKAFRKVNKKFEWFGWAAILVGFFIVCYYAIIMSYCFNYVYHSLTLAWGDDPGSFFYQKTLGLTQSPFELGGIKGYILLGLFLSWIAIFFSIWKGVKTVGKVVYATVLIPWFFLILLVIRGVTLPGAVEGLKFYLTPDFQKLLSYQVWLAAYTQVFFSLSVGFGIMIAYSSFLPRKTDIVNNAFIISLSNCATSFLAGFAVFGALGYYAVKIGKPVADVVASGPGLAFVTYPHIINNLPFWQPLFGVMFFLMLLTLGIDSAFSLAEAVAAGVRDKWKISHRISNIVVCSIALIIGIIFTTGAGLLWLDILDNFMNKFGLSLVCLGECILIGWIFGSGKIKEYVNGISEFRIGIWWDIFIRFLIPVILGVLILFEILERIKGSYGSYPRLAEFLGGWMMVLLLPILGIILMIAKRTRPEGSS